VSMGREKGRKERGSPAQHRAQVSSPRSGTPSREGGGEEPLRHPSVIGSPRRRGLLLKLAHTQSDIAQREKGKGGEGLRLNPTTTVTPAYDYPNPKLYRHR